MDCLCGVQRGLFLTVMRFETLALMEASSWVLLGWRHRMVIDLLCWSSGLAAEGILGHELSVFLLRYCGYRCRTVNAGDFSCSDEIKVQRRLPDLPEIYRPTIGSVLPCRDRFDPSHSFILEAKTSSLFDSETFLDWYLAF